MTQAAPVDTTDLRTALQHATELLQSDPELAANQAREILKVVPDADGAQHILACAYRVQGKPDAALEVLEPLARRLPGLAPVQHELGLCYGALGRSAAARQALQRAVELDPGYSNAWRSLANQLRLVNDQPGYQHALQRHLATSTRHPDLIKAAGHLHEGELALAEPLVREVLKQHPSDVSAIRMLADIGIRVNQYQDAKNLLQRCLELAPDYQLARNNYAVVLLRRQELAAAMEQVDILLQPEPNNPNYLILKASILVRMGEHRRALAIYENILRHYPQQAQAQLNYGHTLKTVGRLDDAIAAYHTAIALAPTLGEAYWSLANLKTYHFDDDEIASMRAAVSTEGGDADEQSHLAFALGKALEDRREYDESFAFYRRGNAIRRRGHRFDIRKNIYNTARQIQTCSAEFFEQRTGLGCGAPDPIFIVGLPRAGSTLLEQILASHSEVEGTGELPDIIAISRRLGGRQRERAATRYPEILAELTPEQLQDLGQNYLASTRIQRGQLPYFIDKMPNNFLHIGLIHLILPNAKIIDARRHPMAGCFAAYKQLFAQGQTFSYDLSDLGHYYRNYVKLMDHWEQVLPGRVLQVQYEAMVADPEPQIRRLLEHCGLAFEPACLTFYETERAVRTPSSEQVRQPIFTRGLGQWRYYERHLDPLKQALGPLLERYPIA